MSELTQARLNELLHYEPDSGVFTWLQLPVATARCIVGEAAGTMSHGYCRISIDGRPYQAHRLAFLWMTGLFPQLDVDHINRDRSDNRWSNLREASKPQNQANSGLNPYNTSGHKGVCWHRQSARWQAFWREGGKEINRRFQELADAIACRQEAMKRIYGEFAREEA